MAADRKQAAKKFREHWLLAKDSELGGYQKFWISLLGDVLGAKDVLTRIDFQLPVPMGTTTKFLDSWIPETKVLIEHKKSGVKLDAPQSGHGGMRSYRSTRIIAVGNPENVANNDRAVLSACVLSADTSEHEIVARLFEMYKEKSAL